jgi:predicted small metal-binding protein
MTCDCGRTLTGQDDEELFREAKEHMHYEHPDLIMTDGQIRDLVAAKAREGSQAASA